MSNGILCYDVLYNHYCNIHICIDEIKSDLNTLNSLRKWTEQTAHVKRSGRYVSFSCNETFLMFRLIFG